MGALKKILVGGGIATGVISGLRYYLRLKKAYEQMETTAVVSLYKIGKEGVSVKIDITLKNPSKIKFKVNFPFVKVHYKGTMIGSSQVLNKQIEVPSFGEARIPDVTVLLPLSQLLFLGGGFVEVFQNGKPLELVVKTNSLMDLGWINLPYEKEQKINLTLPANVR